MKRMERIELGLQFQMVGGASNAQKHNYEQIMSAVSLCEEFEAVMVLTITASKLHYC